MARHRRGDRAPPRTDRDFEDVRAAARPRDLVGLHDAAVRRHDAAYDRPVDRVAARVRAADLDPYDVTALCGRDDDRGVGRTGALGCGAVLAGRVDTGDVRDEVRERGREPGRVDLGLDGRRVHGELGTAGPDQVDRPVDAGRHDPVEERDALVQRLRARIQALVAQDVVDERRHAGVPGGEVVQDLVGLGPELPGVVRGEGAQLGAQLLEGAAQGLGEDGRELLVPGGEGGVPLLLRLPVGGVPLGAVGEFGGVPFGEFGEFGGVLLGERRDFGGVFLDELLVRPAVGEGHDGADELVAVADGGGRHVDRYPVALLRPEDLPADAVLPAGLEGVGER